jgi:hypothetical protein
MRVKVGNREGERTAGGISRRRSYTALLEMAAGSHE